MQAVLESGHLALTNPDGTRGTRPFHMAMLEDRHIPEIMALQEIILGRLRRKEMLQPFSLEFMKRHVRAQGRIFGVIVDERVVAFRNIFFPEPEDTEWNLGINLGFSRTDLVSVVNFQMVCVHPDFRGNNLALRMNLQALRYLRAARTHRHVCATVSPYNYWNVRVLLESGFVIRNIKPKYGGKLRFIVYRNLDASRPDGINEGVAVMIGDIPRQAELLQAGFSGIGINMTPEFHIAMSSDPIWHGPEMYNGCEVVYARV
ncbi:MAG: hypothetical protein ACOZF0_10360 [Thermodesulfobacteriota bacterium]